MRGPARRITSSSPPSARELAGIVNTNSTSPPRQQGALAPRKISAAYFLLCSSHGNLARHLTPSHSVPAATTMFATLRLLARATRHLPNPDRLPSYAQIHIDPQPKIDSFIVHARPDSIPFIVRHVRMSHFEQCRGFGPKMAARLVDKGCKSWADVIAKDDQHGSGVSLGKRQKAHLYHHLALDGQLGEEDERGPVGQWIARLLA